jgi:hypothetical protein
MFLPNRCQQKGEISNSQTPPLVEEKAPFQNTQQYGNNKNMVMGSDGSETKNDCVGEGQQQFTGLDWKLVAVESQ